MKKILATFLAITMILSAVLIPGTAIAETETEPKTESYSLINCEDTQDGWWDVPDYSSVCSTDTENKVEGEASIKLTNELDAPASANVRSMCFFRSPQLIDLSECITLTYRLYISRDLIGSNGFQVNLISGNDGTDGFNFMTDISDWQQGWHEISLDLTNPPVVAAEPDYSMIKILRFTWFNYAGGENVTFNIDDIRAVRDPDAKKPSIEDFNTDPNVVFGDLDGSKTDTTGDALTALQYSARKITEMTDVQMTLGDVNGDDIINTQDALLILQRAVGKRIVYEGEIMYYSYLEKSLAVKHKLEFDENGEFRILQISDIHNNANGGKLHTETGWAISKMIDDTNPDLVVLNGDTLMREFNGTYEENFNNVKGILTDLNDVFAAKDVYYVITFGNHDTECTVEKETQMEIFSSFDHCLAIPGTIFPDQTGRTNRVGNFVCPVYDTKGQEILFNVWCLDSGEFVRGDEKKGIEGDTNAFVLPAQIEWYKDTSFAMEIKAGKKAPGFVFTHVPLPEFNEIPADPEGTGMTGKKGEGVCCSKTNTGMFAAYKERGDVLGHFSAHDHLNTFSGVYQGIELAYDGSLAYDSYAGYYGQAPSQKYAGGRLLTIKQDDIENYTSEFVQYVPANQQNISDTPSIDVPATVKLKSDGTFDLTIDYAGCKSFDTWFGIYPASTTTYQGNSFECRGYFATGGSYSGLDPNGDIPYDGRLQVNSANMCTPNYPTTFGSFTAGEEYQIVMFYNDRDKGYEVIAKDTFTLE